MIEHRRRKAFRCRLAQRAGSPRVIRRTTAAVVLLSAAAKSVSAVAAAVKSVARKKHAALAAPRAQEFSGVHEETTDVAARPSRALQTAVEQAACRTPAQVPRTPRTPRWRDPPGPVRPETPGVPPPGQLPLPAPCRLSAADRPRAARTPSLPSPVGTRLADHPRAGRGLLSRIRIRVARTLRALPHPGAPQLHEASRGRFHADTHRACPYLPREDHRQAAAVRPVGPWAAAADPVHLLLRLPRDPIAVHGGSPR